MSIFNFFKRRTLPEPQPQSEPQPDIEEIIWRIAEYGNRSDEELLWRLMADRSVYVPGDPSTMPAHVKSGEKYVATSGDHIQIRCTTGPGGGKFTCAATRPDNAMLAEGYFGMEWREFLQMTVNLGPEVGGFLLQGQRSWVGLERKNIDDLLHPNGV